MDLNLVQLKSIKKQRKCIKTNKLKHEYCYITAHKTAILSQGAVDLKLIGCWWWFNILTTIKFIYSEKATKFCEIFTLIWVAVHRTKVRRRFRKIVWPSQKIWTLLNYTTSTYTLCRRLKVLRGFHEFSRERKCGWQIKNPARQTFPFYLELLEKYHILRPFPTKMLALIARAKICTE